MGNHQEAIACCKRSMDLDETFAPAKLSLAAFVLESEDPEAAMTILSGVEADSVLESDSSYRDYLKGIAFLKMNRKHDAAKSFERSIYGNSDFFRIETSEIWYLKAVAELQLNNIESATNSCERSLANVKTPKEDALLLMWTLYRKNERNLAAFEIAKRAATSYPMSNRSQTALLTSFVRLKQLGAAVEVADKILASDPQHELANKVFE